MRQSQEISNVAVIPRKDHKVRAALKGCSKPQLAARSQAG